MVDRLRLRDLRLFAFAVAIGVIAAFGALAFRTLIELFQNAIWGPGLDFLAKVEAAPWWLVVGAPAAAGLAVGPVIYKLAPELKGPGVPEVIVSVTSRRSMIRHRVTALKSLVTSLLIGAGASVGREGPVVQIGASVGSSLAQLFRLPGHLRRVCLAAGAAAGIAATFNAPIAGTLFAIEVILLDIEIAYISHIIVAAITASFVSRLFWGDFPAFDAGHFALSGNWELVVYLGLGVAAGILSVGFMHLVFTTDKAFERLPVPGWIKPALGGVLLGLIALELPQVMGVGYETVNLALSSSMALGLAALLLLAKAAATAVCLGSGMSGGVFAPSLVLGAGLGTVVALAADALVPGANLVPGHYALAGMGAFVAGTTLAPITAVLTIFELTDSYRVIMPLMAACITSSVVCRLFFGHSIYEMKLLKQGVSIVRGHDVGILRDLSVAEYMHRDFEALSVTDSFRDVLAAATSSPYPHFVVLDEKGLLAGVLSLRDLRAHLAGYADKTAELTAGDIMTREVVGVSASDSMVLALHLFEEHHISLLPVTLMEEDRRVVGVLKKDDLLMAYKERVLKSRVLSTSL